MTHTVSPQGKEARPKKAKTFIVIIRPEFKAICQDDACRAGMLNHILYNIARAKQQGSEYWHSTGDDIWEETQRSWGKSKTLKEIKDLVTTGLVAQTSNPRNSWDRTKYYTFGEAEAKKLHELCVKNKVCLASIKFPVAVSHLLKITNAFCKNNKCICCNQQIDLLDLTDRFVDFNIPTDLEAACGDASEVSKDSTQDSTQDSFLHADEVALYSQPCEPANEEKKEEPEPVSHMREDLDVKMDALTEEYCAKIQPPKVLSAIPDVPPMAVTAKQIEAQRKRRMADILVLADQEVGARVPRSPKKFVQEAVEDLCDGDYSDAQIVFSIQDLKARNRDLTFTEIAKNMANAVNKLKNNLPPGILAFKPQPPPQETRLAPRTKDMSHLGDHLNPADYDEEVFIYRPVRRG